MRFSKTELEVLKETGKPVKKIARTIKKSEKQVYVSLKKLKNKVKNNTLYQKLLINLLNEHPTIHEVLADSGIPILSTLPATIKEIEKSTGLKKAMIYRKLKQFKNRSIITKKEKKFRINKIWNDLIEVIKEIKKYEENKDDRAPLNSKIYFKNEREIIFSTKEEVNAAKTAFSAFEKYKMPVFLKENYYYLPNKKLTKKEVLKHTLKITKKEKTIQKLILLAIFYAKHRKEFKTKDEILIKIKRVLDKEKIEGYPSYEEIKERAKVYGVKI